MRKMKRHWGTALKVTALFALGLSAASELGAQMIQGTRIPGYEETMGVSRKNDKKPYACVFASSSVPGNILWPGEQAEFTFQLINNSKQPIKTTGKVETISYGTKGRPGDIWTPDMFRNGIVCTTPIDVDIAPGKYQNITVKPQTPDKLGPYALVVDLGQTGRRFVTGFIRTFKADSREVHYPQLALDVNDVDILTRLGACPNRIGLPFKPPSDKDFDKWFKNRCQILEEYKKAKLPITVEFGAGANHGPTLPLGMTRPHLDADGNMLRTKSDYTWLPSYDPEFKKLVKLVLKEYGWPRGPVIGVKYMNEPWEGISISGWGADMPRYRQIFKTLCEATVEARKEYDVDVLIGGCDSSTNTFDKLFGDGNMEFLKYLDFCSIHYQGMSCPSTVKDWVNRKSPNGRVKIWDTESWVANTDDRVSAVMATNLSTGYDRAVGIFHGNICSEDKQRMYGDDGKLKNVKVPTTWSVAASIGAAEHFIGQRKFKELLFRNGLPWVMVFNGNVDASGKADEEDGTVVVVGDIGEEFGHDWMLFRTANGFKEIEHKQALKKQLAALPKGAPEKERKELETQLRADETLSGAQMTLANPDGRFSLYDFYGNPVPAADGKIVVPLDGRGFFLRGNGEKGAFTDLLKAIRNSRVDGIEPLAKKVRDMLSPVDSSGSSFRLELTNVLNRPVQGQLQVQLNGLKCDPASQTVAFAPNETKVLTIGVSGKPRPDNTYHLNMVYDAGKDGKSLHEEDVHVNLIAKRTIKIDGNLEDWKGVLPQTIASDNDSGPTMTEKAWLPFIKFDKGQTVGFSNGYLAYDDQNFYFAARVADSTPDGGTLRFEKRNDDEYYYPKESYMHDLKKAIVSKEIQWNTDVRIPYALRTPDGKGRNQKVWEGLGKLAGIDLALPSDHMTQVAVYFIDHDFHKSGRRVQSVQIVDPATGKKLAETKVKEFGDGVYAIFNASGKVRVLTRALSWPTVTVAGVFMDKTDTKAATSPSAKFIKLDGKTGGDWQGHYGAEGYLIPGISPQFNGDIVASVTSIDAKKTLTWPEGVRRYSYRKRPILPCGNAPKFDNIQIAFNVLDQKSKSSFMNPPGTMPGYIAYEDTDYEYALNKVGDAFGGGTEIWRLKVPGMPHKQFYPRQGKSPFDGPVKGGELVVVQGDTTRTIECAIPWSELPDVKKCLDAGKTVKFSFRVNDNKAGGCMELSKKRSVAKRNVSFHADWVEHWANELEFAFEKESK